MAEIKIRNLTVDLCYKGADIISKKGRIEVAPFMIHQQKLLTPRMAMIQ